MSGDGPLVLPFVGVITTPDILPAAVARECAAALFPLDGTTSPRLFDFTSYYEPEMGRGLIRFWLGGAALRPAGELPAWKRKAGELEDAWRGGNGGRRVNLDPGYIAALQLVLATTKPLPQATYARDGIFAVVELLFHDGAFHPVPWTYGDYAAAAADGTFLLWRERFRALTARFGRGNDGGVPGY